MAVRLQRHGAMMAIPSCHGYYFIAVRWLCNRSAMTKPSYRRHKAMILR
ncbi:MAG: hypothetical protein IIU87_09275 [Prevotella sp.]|nr:hypothetical protein [Prevotella sp.]